MEQNAPRRGRNNRRQNNNNLGTANNNGRNQADGTAPGAVSSPRPPLRANIGSQGANGPNGTRPPVPLPPLPQSAGIVPPPPNRAQGGGQENRGGAPPSADGWAIPPPTAAPVRNRRSAANNNQQQTPRPPPNPRRNQNAPPTNPQPRNNQNQNARRSNQAGPQNSNNPGASNNQNNQNDQPISNKAAKRRRARARRAAQQAQGQTAQNGNAPPQQTGGRRANRNNRATQAQSAANATQGNNSNAGPSTSRPNPSPPAPAPVARATAPNPPVAAQVSNQTEPALNVSDLYNRYSTVGPAQDTPRVSLPRPVAPVAPVAPIAPVAPREAPIQRPVRVSTLRPATSSVVLPSVPPRIPTPIPWDNDDSDNDVLHYEDWPVYMRPLPPHAATQPTASTSNRPLSSVPNPPPPARSAFAFPPSPPPIRRNALQHNPLQHSLFPNPWSLADDADSSDDDISGFHRTFPPLIPVQPRASASTQPRASTSAQPRASTAAQPRASASAQPRASTSAQPGASTSSHPLRSSTSPCSICLDPPNAFPSLRPTTRCTHKSTVCAPCLEQHISHAVLSDGSTTVRCPEAGCGQTMAYSDVVRGAKNDKKCLARYETLLLRRTLAAEPNFVWCKSTTCDWGQVHGSGANAPIVICQVCRARSCFTHDVPWHTGLTCAQYDAQRTSRARETRENLASEAYIQQHAKSCPNTACNRKIEKNEGCDHMTCRRPVGCGHEFCWVCLADYGPIRNQGNHHHRPSCRYYAAIEGRTPWARAVPEATVIPPPVPHATRVPALPRYVPAYPTPLHRAPTPPRPAPRPPAPAPRPAVSWWNWFFGGGRTTAAAA